jgi:hypothetical protein
MPPSIVRRGDIDPEDLARQVRRGDLIRIRHGVYAAPPPEGPAWSVQRHRLLARAAAVHAVREASHWFSHETAAVLWGCDVAPHPTVVDVTTPVRTQVVGAREPGVRRHWTARTDRRADVCHDLALPVSSLERTVVDCACSLRRGPALVIADSALRIGADTDRIGRLLAAGGGERGIRRARQVLALADGRSDSPGETLVRLAIIDAGLPGPEPQLAVPTRLGWRWVDLGWRAERVAVEFDGRGKYGADADTVVRAFVDERRRQAALEDEGWQVIRATWSDLSRPAELTARIARSLRRAPHRHRGRAVSPR